MPAGAWLQSVWRIRKVADSLGSPSPCVPSARQGPRQLAPVAPAAPPAALQRAADPLGRDTGRHARQHGTAGPTDCTIMGPGVQAAAGGLQAPCQCSVGRGWMAARCFLLSCKLVRSASRLLPSSVAFYQWYGQLLRPVQQRHVLQFPLCRWAVAQHPIQPPESQDLSVAVEPACSPCFTVQSVWAPRLRTPVGFAVQCTWCNKTHACSHHYVDVSY